MDPFINATPRPWVFDNEAIWSGAFVVVEFDALNGNADEREASARLIVAAVNERDALREEIRRLRDALLAARWRLSKGKPLWNGPCHECDAALLKGLTGVNVRSLASDREVAEMDAGERDILERIRKLLEDGNG